MNQALEIDSVSKSFGGLRAVDEVSLTVDAGDAMGVIGPNGAGKTTLFNLISGILRPDSGSIRLEGRTISGLKPQEISRLGVARTFQTPRPFGRMSVLENVMVGLLFGRRRSMSVGVARRRSSEVLDLVSLEHKSGTLAVALTLSEQRRLELARALATDPKVLILDEVMAGLTRPESIEMVSIIKLAKQEGRLTLLVTEHLTRAIVELCNRLTVMNRGVILAEGAPPEVLRKEGVVYAYMGVRTRGNSLPS
ncbi:MAG: ABC transporter ATP-binding protein [Nitrososphaerales archaeon]|nr:ABC transporter ATP-binding protein [Nitrososphaerales archaeon]